LVNRSNGAEKPKPAALKTKAAARGRPTMSVVTDKRAARSRCLGAGSFQDTVIIYDK